MHRGLPFRLNQNGTSAASLKVSQDSLSSCKQRVDLNDELPQGVILLQTFPKALSILRPLFFLIYTNELPETLSSNPKLFTDDTSLFAKVCNIIKARN